VPLEQRIQEVPASLLQFLRDSDSNPLYSSYKPSQNDLIEVQKNLHLLPKNYLSILQDRLIGIYFIQNWVGSGAADYVLDSNDEIYAILILNPEVLRHNISDWVTYREQTCYKPRDAQDKDIRVRIDCGIEYTGLTYVLLHETSHIIDYMRHYTPYVEDNIRELGLGVQETAFTSPIWQTYNQPQPVNDFTKRKELSFYGVGRKPTIHFAEADALYKDLSRTPFSSLYGSRNWAEDFAEYITWYYLTQVLHQPYKIEVQYSDEIEYIYSPMESLLVLKRAESIGSLLE
jgi:hypothetical protein